MQLRDRKKINYNLDQIEGNLYRDSEEESSELQNIIADKK